LIVHGINFESNLYAEAGPMQKQSVNPGEIIAESQSLSASHTLGSCKPFWANISQAKAGPVLRPGFRLTSERKH
jgi:hypothetical protein